MKEDDVTIKLYEVGGCVRDGLLGKPSKDVDFVVVADSYEAMRNYVQAEGFRVFVEKPEFVTIRCSIPDGHPLRARTKDADFVLARKDGPSTDGRRPDFVEPGTLEDDLARRDFTVNAIAFDPITSHYHDPHGGRADLEQQLLRFVGEPMARIREDGLRVLRGLRFLVTKGLKAELNTWEALTSVPAAMMLESVSMERIREEIEKMFAHDTLRSLWMLNQLSDFSKERIFRGGLRLSATLRKT